MKHKAISVAVILSCVFSTHSTAPAYADDTSLSFTTPQFFYRGKPFTFTIKSDNKYPLKCEFRTQGGAQIVGGSPVTLKNGVARKTLTLMYPRNAADGSQWAIVTWCSKGNHFGQGYQWITGYLP